MSARPSSRLFESLCLLVVLCSCAVARPTPDIAKRGNKILVVLPDLNDQVKYSQFFQGLQGQGFELSATAANSPFTLSQFGEYLFDHVIVFNPEGEEIGERVSAHSFVDFVNHGGNVIVAGGGIVSELLREFASQSGVEYDQGQSVVVDHFHSVSSLDGGDHTTVYSSNIIPNKFIFPVPISGPVITKGTGIVISNSPYAFNILRAESTAYTVTKSKPVSSTPFALGKAIGLVSAVQARNNARVVFTGSVELFSDSFANAMVNGQKSANAAFVQALSNWTFQRSGVVRISNAKHHRETDVNSLSWYRIKDDMVYTVRIEHRNGAHWEPFVADDVQMEAIMLDPYLRVPLTHDNQGNFTAHFKLPDVYGMYTLRVIYFRHGLSHLEISDIISVRPFRHNEYERFIDAAYPYYTASLSMLVGIVIFSFVFLYHREPAQHQQQREKKTQ